jgi:hypothetical protein
MASVIEQREPNDSDRQAVKDFFYAMPIIGRAKPVFFEMLWVWSGCPDEDRHNKTLPDYCYNILEAVRRTYFKNVPGMTDTINVKDRAALSGAKTIEEAKKVIQMDWRNLGRICGIGLRCCRFAKMEAETVVNGEGFGNMPPEKRKELFTVIFGKQWAAGKAKRISSENPDNIFAELFNQHVDQWSKEINSTFANMSSVASLWSPAAMCEFYAGFGEGLASFVDETGQLVGQTNRSDTYVFLALAWPEIKAMQESHDPRKTLTDLHQWMLPFMRMAVTPFLDIETFRDVCAPPSQAGIGLSLRPLRSRHLLPSA